MSVLSLVCLRPQWQTRVMSVLSLVCLRPQWQTRVMSVLSLVCLRPQWQTRVMSVLSLVCMVNSDMAKPLLSGERGDPRGPLPCGDTIGIQKVVVGSRNPKRSSALFPADAEVTFQADAVRRSEVIFVAVFRDHYSALNALEEELAGKILVDVSNNPEINVGRESNAEFLAALFPRSTVIKAFNVISAWALQSGPQDGNKQVRGISPAPFL
ncbi:PREDICTED: metalloreductase STEAP3-like [Nanorana parkeri]|uniref:metalloreductase STEAP3-like n=1 Tax=Nanorana parkeri TaxID=125878 RepID=UPI000854DB9D|nr:PREDICTED: metalloreductase STEAP3-like [Nanorana parkeri]